MTIVRVTGRTMSYVLGAFEGFFSSSAFLARRKEG